MKNVFRFACTLLLVLPGMALAQAADQPVLPPTLDEQYVALAEQIPGFGGLYHDSAGRVIVRLKDLGQAPAARRAVGAFLAGRGVFARAGAAQAEPPRTTAQPRELTFVKGEYDFRDLAHWRRQIEEASLDVLTMSDIDEVANRLLIGVVDEAARKDLADSLKDLGIPPAAVILRVIPPVVEENLQGSARPVRGGLQVNAVGPGWECTLGFVALREYPGQIYSFGGPRYVITNSHCTSAFAADTDNVIGQPNPADRIGVEFSDPPLTSNAVDSACPSSSNVCRRSDAAMFLLDDNSSSTSTFNGVATASGLTLTGTAFYAGKQQGFAPNMAVSKIGRTSGQTSGTVTNTCVNVPISGRVMVCQMYATYASQGGDSGSPVWFTDSSGNRWIMGIHWGRDNVQNRAIFSVWMDVYSEIANDVLARTGEQWMPALTTGPANFSTQ